MLSPSGTVDGPGLEPAWHRGLGLGVHCYSLVVDVMVTDIWKKLQWLCLFTFLFYVSYVYHMGIVPTGVRRES